MVGSIFISYYGSVGFISGVVGGKGVILIVVVLFKNMFGFGVVFLIRVVIFGLKC